MKRIFCLIAVLIVTISMLPMAASAQEAVQLNKSGSITLKLYYDGKPIKDGSFACIQVADIIEKDGSYHFRQLLEKKVYKELPKASDVQQLVKDNKKFFLSSDYTIYHTNSTGTVTFSGRKPGLYLIMQDKKFKDYSTMTSFLVTLPYQNNDGTYCNDVNANVKSELKKEYTSPTTPGSSGSSSGGTTIGSRPSGGKLPQTGQLSWPIPWMTACGMLLFALGWWQFFGSRKDTYET